MNAIQVMGVVRLLPRPVSAAILLVTLELSFTTGQVGLAQVTFQSSNLPILIVDTDGQPIRDEPKIVATLTAIDNGPGERNSLEDPPTAYDGFIGIEYRGSSSLALFPKKSFAMETRNADGSNRNVSLLGLPKENDWVLYGPYSDKSLIRNVLAFHVARATGRYASGWRFVELVINDSYEGLYVLLERVKRDNDRVDISPLEPTDTSGDALTGGYILKIDKTDGAEVGGWYSRYATATDPSRKTFYQYHYPRPSDIVSEQEAYIRAFVEDFEDVIASSTFADSLSGYPALVNVAALIDYILLTEVTHNVDGYRLSTFFYKDRDSIDGRLTMGPAWDYNIAFGNANYYEGESIAGFRIHTSVPRSDAFHAPAWWTRFLDDQELVSRISERWANLRAGLLSTDSLMSFIDNTVTSLDESQRRNFERWPVLGEWIWPNVVVEGSWLGEVGYLKSWLRQRVEWLDANIQKIGGSPVGVPVPYVGVDVNVVVYPNPAAGDFRVDVSVPSGAGRIQVRVYDSVGRLVAMIGDRFITQAGTFTFEGSIRGLPVGNYFVRALSSAGSSVAELAIVRL